MGDAFHAGLDGTTIDETCGSAAVFPFVDLTLGRVGATASVTAARTSRTGAMSASGDSARHVQPGFNVRIQARAAVAVSLFVVRAVLCLEESLVGWHAGLQEPTLFQLDSVRQGGITRLGRHKIPVLAQIMPNNRFRSFDDLSAEEAFVGNISSRQLTAGTDMCTS